MQNIKTPPPENYTSGATIFGSFQVQQPDDEFEVYVVVGRSGEPITANSSSSNGQSKSTWDPPGVFVNRYTTKDFVTWSAPVSRISRILLYNPRSNSFVSLKKKERKKRWRRTQHPTPTSSQVGRWLPSVYADVRARALNNANNASNVRRIVIVIVIGIVLML